MHASDQELLAWAKARLAREGNPSNVDALEKVVRMLQASAPAEPVRNQWNRPGMTGRRSDAGHRAPEPAYREAKDLLPLNGIFTENMLRSKGFSQRMLNEAKDRGFFRVVAGSLVTVDVQHRQRRLPTLIETVPIPGPAPEPVAAPGAPAPVAVPPEVTTIQCPHCGSTFEPEGAPQMGDPAGDDRVQDSPAAASRSSDAYTQESKVNSKNKGFMDFIKKKKDKGKDVDGGDDHDQEESLVDNLLKSPRKLQESPPIPVGTKVTKTINGVAMQCVVTAVEGGTYKLVSADGKNTPMTATQAEVAVTPPTPEEAAKKKALAQKTAAVAPAPTGASPVTNPLG